MKKESIIVGIFGLSLGLLVAWAIWNFKSTAPQPQELTLSPSPVAESNPTPTSTPSFSLSLNKPAEDFIATQSSVAVTGTAKPGATLVISTNLDDYVLTATQDGSFSQEVSLEEGENILSITSYDQDQKEETIERAIIYTKEASS